MLRHSIVLTLAALATSPAPLPDLLSDLAPGLTARTLIRAGDTLTDGSVFSPKNDLTAYLPTGPRDGYLMVGHEIRFGVDMLGGRYTRLKLHDGQVVGGQLWSSGMHNPCAGMLTPWKTILACEEYPHDAYPQTAVLERRKDYETRRVAMGSTEASFGWVYEIDPFGGTPAGRAVRRTALGRYSHESAELVGDRELYLTEDYDPGFFYKFVMAKPRDLSAGKLYAYQREKAAWLPIDDVVNAHQAALKAGATKFVRLEDVKRGPDGALYVAETGHFDWNDPFGRVWRIDPKTNKAAVHIQGDGVHMAQPDNLFFDAQGRLVVCEDQYDANVKLYGANEVARYDGPGRWTRLAATALGAEPTGPTLLPGGHTLVLSVMRGATSGLVAIDGL